MDQQDRVADLDQVEEEILTASVSDEALEAAAATEREANSLLTDYCYFGCR